MAIKCNFELKNNFGESKLFNDAYIKVNSLTGGKLGIVSFVQVFDHHDGKILYAFNSEFVPQLDASNFIAQAYQDLKSKPEFANCIDC